MKRRATILIGGLLTLLMATGCEREITGDVAEVDNNRDNCLECHSGYLDQAQGEWANSIHASGNNIDYTNRGGSDCTRCHNQQGFVQFLETGELPDVPFETVSAIGCFACHNPHETGTLELRSQAAYTLENGDVFDHGKANLCVHCHHSRISAESITDDFEVTSTHWGTHHGPQGDLLNGSNGWEFPGEGYNFPKSPHRLVVEDACVGCHMGNPRTHVGYDLGGHSFNMESEETTETLSGLCADASCHGSTVKEYDFLADHDYDGDGVREGYQTEIDGLLESLAVLLEGQGVLEDNEPVEGTIADANLAGALYNYIFLEEDRSHGIHNFKYAKALIDASIDYVSQLPARTPSGDLWSVQPALIKSH